MEPVRKEIELIQQKLDIIVPIREDVYDIIDHGELVRMLVYLLARRMGIGDKELDTLVIAAGVHDVGKLKLGNYLYGRDKRALHVEEVRHMRTHAAVGRDMLAQCGYDEDILDAVYHHHENYDGSGYPDNLSGENIPLNARIIRVCDAFAALVSDRPYRKAFDMDAAIDMMIEDIKTFDMRIFLEFMKMYHSDEFARAMELSREINAKQRYIFVNNGGSAV